MLSISFKRNPKKGSWRALEGLGRGLELLGGVLGGLGQLKLESLEGSAGASASKI